MSAARYTNRLRTQAEARVRKVQYRYNEALNYNPLAATCAVSPDFSVLQYSGYRNCRPPCPPPLINLYFLDGGNAYTNVYDGRYAPPTLPNILQDVFFMSSDLAYDGGSSYIVVSTPDYDSGTASNNFNDLIQSNLVLSDVILDSGHLITLQNPIYVAGSGLSVDPTIILDGGKTVPL